MLLKGALVKLVLPRVADAVTEAIKRGATKHEARAEAVDAVTDMVKSDPIARSALNQEPLWQSGVANYTLGGIIVSAGAVYLGWKNNEIDARFFMELATLVTVAMAFAKRTFLKSKPMWSRVQSWLS